MSDTPRTDAIHDFEWRCEHHPDHQEGMVTSAMIEIRLSEESDELREHARQLERELAALRAQLAERDAEIAALKGHAENMCRILQIGDGGFDSPATAAYRAAYPKE